MAEAARVVVATLASVFGDHLNDPRTTSSDLEFVWAVAKVGIYFITLGTCLYHCIRDMWPTNRVDAVPARRPRLSRLRRVGGAMVLVMFVAINFAVTWRYIYQFMRDDYEDFSVQWHLPKGLRGSATTDADVRSPRIAAAPTADGDPSAAARNGHNNAAVVVGAPVRDWISQSDWFVKAYEHVRRTELQWLWSSSLLLLVCTIAAFVYIESYRCALRGGSNMWLGCVAAISVSTPLLLCAMLNTSNETYFSRIAVPGRFLLGICVTVSLITIVLVPSAETEFGFTLLLGIMHAAVAIPALFVQFFRSANATDVACIRFLRHLSKSQVPNVASPTPADPSPVRGRLVHATTTPTPSSSSTAGASSAAAGSSAVAPPAPKYYPATTLPPEAQPEGALRASVIVNDQNWPSRMYAAIAAAAMFTLLHSWVHASGNLPRLGVLGAMWDAATANPCQKSVSYDFVASSLSMLFVVWFDRFTPKSWAFATTLGALLVSPCVAIPFFLSARESYMVRRFDLAIVRSMAQELEGTKEKLAKLQSAFTALKQQQQQHSAAAATSAKPLSSTGNASSDPLAADEPLTSSSRPAPRSHAGTVTPPASAMNNPRSPLSRVASTHGMA